MYIFFKMTDFVVNNKYIEMAKRKKRRRRRHKMSRGQGNRRCWEGYKATPGKTPYSKGSCTKKYQLKF